MKPKKLDEKGRLGIFEFRTALLLMLAGLFMGYLISRDTLCRLHLHGPEVDDLQRASARRQWSEGSSSAEDLSHEDCDNYSM